MKAKVYIVVNSWTNEENHYQQFRKVYGNAVDAYKEALEISNDGCGNKGEVLEFEIEIESECTINYPMWGGGKKDIYDPNLIPLESKEFKIDDGDTITNPRVWCQDKNTTDVHSCKTCLFENEAPRCKTCQPCNEWQPKNKIISTFNFNDVL